MHTRGVDDCDDCDDCDAGDGGEGDDMVAVELRRSLTLGLEALMTRAEALRAPPDLVESMSRLLLMVSSHSNAGRRGAWQRK
jgi:hypothetical protein